MVKNHLKKIINDMGISHSDILRYTDLNSSTISRMSNAEDLGNFPLKTVLKMERFIGRRFYTDDLGSSKNLKTYHDTRLRKVRNAMSKVKTAEDMVKFIKKHYGIKNGEVFRFLHNGLNSPYTRLINLPLVLSNDDIHLYYGNHESILTPTLISDIKRSFYDIELKPYRYKVGDIFYIENIRKSSSTAYGVIKEICDDKIIVKLSKGAEDIEVPKVSLSHYYEINLSLNCLPLDVLTSFNLMDTHTYSCIKYEDNSYKVYNKFLSIWEEFPLLTDVQKIPVYKTFVIPYKKIYSTKPWKNKNK